MTETMFWCIAIPGFLFLYTVVNTAVMTATGWDPARHEDFPKVLALWLWPFLLPLSPLFLFIAAATFVGQRVGLAPRGRRLAVDLFPVGSRVVIRGLNDKDQMKDIEGFLIGEIGVVTGKDMTDSDVQVIYIKLDRHEAFVGLESYYASTAMDDVEPGTCFLLPMNLGHAPAIFKHPDWMAINERDQEGD